MRSLIEQFRERRLIGAAKRGDHASFDTLCRRHRNGLYGFICSRVPRDRAEDLVQDVWMTSWERLSTFAGRSSYRSWILGIAVNKIREHRRKPVEYTNCENEAEEHDPNSTRSESDDIVLRVTVRDAIDTLPEQQREVIDMYYFAGLSLPEIACSLDRNLNTVKYQFYAAHDRVAGIIEPFSTAQGARRESREPI